MTSVTINKGKTCDSKICVLGNPGVGKSALVVRFLTNRFIWEYDPTLATRNFHKRSNLLCWVRTCDPASNPDDDVNLAGVQKLQRTYKHHILVDEELTLMEILDTAGQTHHREETIQHEGNFRWADGYMLVYAINDRQSFLAVGELKQHLDLVKKTNIQCLLVGNKADLLHDRQVATDEGEALAQELACGFFETSARDGGGDISEIFYELHRDIRRRKLVESKGRRRSSAQQVKHVFNRMLNKIGSTS